MLQERHMVRTPYSPQERSTRQHQLLVLWAVLPKGTWGILLPFVVYPRPDFYLNTFYGIMGPKYYDLKMGNISMKRGKCFKPNGSLHEVMGEVQTYIKQCILFHLFVYYY